MNAVVVAAAAALLQSGSLAQSGVRVGVAIQPDTVRVGQPVTLIVRIEAPAGTRITFPPAVDSTASIEPLDPVVVRETRTASTIDVTGTYRFLAWELGALPIPLQPILLTRGDRNQELTLGDPRVVVVSVLPADSAQRVPRPARDIILLPPSRWPWWLLIVAGFALAALVGWLLQRRARPVDVRLEPYAEAQRAFGRLNALDLVGAGEPAKHVSACADIVRAFLAARDPNAALGLTTAELLVALRDDGAVPAYRVAALLTAADAIKFAGQRVDATTAEALGAEAIALVTEIHRAELQRAKR